MKVCNTQFLIIINLCVGNAAKLKSDEVATSTYSTVIKN